MWNCGDNLFKQRLPNIMYSSKYQCPNRGTLLITLPDPGLGMSGGISRAWSGVADWWPPCHCVDTRQLIAFIIVKHSVTGESSRGQQIILKGLKIFLLPCGINCSRRHLPLLYVASITVILSQLQ